MNQESTGSLRQNNSADKTQLNQLLARMLSDKNTRADETFFHPRRECISAGQDVLSGSIVKSRGQACLDRWWNPRSVAGKWPRIGSNESDPAATAENSFHCI